MPLCVKCNRIVCYPCIRALTGSKDQPKVVVATDDELRTETYFRRLAMATAALKSELKITRREIPDWMADVIHKYDGRIVWPHGGPFSVSDTGIDDAFNNDGSFRWLSEFMKFAVLPPKQPPQFRVLTRLRLIDLAFRVARPDVARHFKR